ncbi:MAG: ABC transporter substrate-binding protein [Treponema sp.]|nr:ABC transporter substrate-binding protein [Treponema sp.]
MKVLKIVPVLMLLAFAGCKKVPEMTLEEIDKVVNLNSEKIIEKTVSKPYRGEDFSDGKVGGIWYSSIDADPKTFNALIAERDGSSNAIMSQLTDYIVDYDFIKKKWIPRLCFFEIEVDEKNDILTVHFTVRDDAYWSYYGKDEKIPVTSDDVVWWYDNVSGNPDFQSSAYSGQFVMMKDGSYRRIEAKKIDDRHFDFIYPRIIANPMLASNVDVKPCWLYKEAFEKNGTDGVKNIFSINTDPKLIPSCGRFFITEYSPGQRLVFTRNPDYWEKNSKGEASQYCSKKICQIIADHQNTEKLLFLQGKLETYSPQPENLSDIINTQGQYTVFNSEGSLGAQLWSFNQNPKNKDKPFYEWFTKKEFRQAMSCLLNRDRIISQTYRGLASPKYNIFPEGNQFYDEKIQLKYKYDRAKAVSLLQSAGFKQNGEGVMTDSKGRPVEFDLAIASTANISNDIAQIIFDECKSVGIKINVRQTDFQKMVEMLTATYDWESLIIGLGSNLFPTQGSNVWPSSGNLHLWYPLQKSPATEWEKRIDYLYNEGSYTIDEEKAKVIWDEYQELLLEQCPLIYLVCPRSFVAINNRWDFTNFYFDNINGAMTEHVYVK